MTTPELPPHADDHTEQGIATQARALPGELDPLIPVFLLIDPMLGEPLAGANESASGEALRARREALWQRPVACITLPARVPLSPHLQPYAVNLSGTDDPLLEMSLELAHAERDAAMGDGLDGAGGSAHRIGGWLQSCLPLPEVGLRLARLMTVNTDARTDKSYLRLADRRVLALLRDVVGDGRLAGALAGFPRWVYLDAQGRLSTLYGGAGEIAPVRLTRDEWGAMEQGEVLHRAMAYWLGESRRRGDARIASRAMSELYSPLRTALGGASEAAARWPHRFQTAEDFALWASLILLHPDLARSIAVDDLMQGGNTPDEPPEALRHMHKAALAALHAETRPGVSP